MEAVIDEPALEWLMIDGIAAEHLLADRGYDANKRWRRRGRVG